MATAIATELLMIGSVIVIGALLGHYALLSVSKRLRHSSSNSIALHRLQALYKQYNNLSSAHPSSSHRKRTSLRRRAQPKSDSRGIIAHLPTYQRTRSNSYSHSHAHSHSHSNSPSHSPSHSPSRLQPTKSPLDQQPSDRAATLHKLITTVHDQNPRSTYLGATTFNESNPSAQLFGWARTPGHPTVELGDIAGIVNPFPSSFSSSFANTGGNSHGSDNACLSVLVHPDDAKTIAEAGWSVRTDPDRNSPAGSMNHRAREDGVAMLLKAPRDQRDLDTVMAVVLDAAVWFVVGLDREENV